MNQKLDELKSVGLNLIATIEVAKLPTEIIEYFKTHQIEFNTEEDTLCLIANGGSTLWDHLPHPLNELTHPFDQFSIDQMKKLDVNARILFPHAQLNIPLQKIGRFLNLSRPSLLGLDINKEFGVWFAFRGAFLTSQKINSKTHEAFESPCNNCIEKPCISACPANAIKTKNMPDLKRCIEFRLTKNSKCVDKCLARLACPYQKIHQYKTEQITYHMTRNSHIKDLAKYL